MTDHGLTHCAIECRDLDRSIDFYERFGGFEVVHRRDGVAWISDRTRPFSIVLAVAEEVRPIGPFAHLGSACRDLVEFNRRLDEARRDGVLREGPSGGDGPAGTWAFLDDPDGNTFEISVGQGVEEFDGRDSVPSGPVKRSVVGVMGSGDDSHEEIAVPLGAAIARAGWHLLTGGGGGVMASVGRGFTHQHPRVGTNLGILRGDALGELLPGYPNPYVEFPIATHLPGGELEADSRNHLNILSSNVVLALPGRVGTQAEIRLAIRYRRAIAVHEFWRDRFPELPVFESVVAAIDFASGILGGENPAGAE
ncbi:MAG: hypothetical protein CMJ23_01110 [Phycisphaerae bacterium]|nr:hypothetical protein [Phycisphaerae bacterium]